MRIFYHDKARNVHVYMNGRFYIHSKMVYNEPSLMERMYVYMNGGGFTSPPKWSTMSALRWKECGRGAVADPLTAHRWCARETMSLPVQNLLDSVDKRLATLSVRCVVGRVVYEHLRKIMQGFHAAWRIHTVEFRKEVSLCLYLPPMSFPIRR